MKKFKISGAWLSFGAIIVIAVCSEVWDYYFGSILNKSGVNLSAVITDVVHSRGYNIKYSYYFKGKRFTQSSNVTEFSCSVGDSLLVKVLPNDPGGNIAIIKKTFSNRVH